jgi:hypothetical protein
MPKPFTEWTVLPHDPIEKLADNLWRVSGKMGRVQRQMVLARRKDGDVVVHNGIALEEPAMKELEAWGAPRVLVVPNGFHRVDAAIWKQRYPKMTVVAPPKGAKRVSKIVPVDMTTAEAPKDDSVELFELDGVPSETNLLVRSGGEVTLCFCDVVMNQPKVPGLMGFLLAPTGKVASPRMARMFFVKDKRALAAHLERLAETPGLKRILFGHGRPVTDDAPAALRQVAAQLVG